MVLDRKMTRARRATIRHTSPGASVRMRARVWPGCLRANSARVTSDKTHVEHNESALTLIADALSDMDFRRNGPIPEVATLFNHLVGALLEQRGVKQLTIGGSKRRDPNQGPRQSRVLARSYTKRPLLLNDMSKF